MRILAIIGALLMAIHPYYEHLSFVITPAPWSTPSRLVTDEPLASPISTSEIELSYAASPMPGTMAGGNRLEGGAVRLSGVPADWRYTEAIEVVKPGATGVGTYSLTDGDAVLGQASLYALTGIVNGPSVTSGDGYRQPAAIALATGEVLVAYEDWVSHRVAVARVGVESHEVDRISAVWTKGSAFTRGPMPVLWTADAGAGLTAVYCLSWQETGSSQLTGRVDYSTDGGENWTYVGMTSIVLDVTSDSYASPRIAWDGCTRHLTLLLLKTSGGTTTSQTYVSDDEYGASWSLLSSAPQASAHAVTAINGLFFRAYVSTTGGLVTAIRTQYDVSWSTQSTVAAVAGAGHLALSVTEPGNLIVHFRDATNAPWLLAMSSKDGGVTWGSDDAMSDNTGRLVTLDQQGATLTEGLVVTSSVAIGGQVLVWGQLVSDDATDYSLVGLVYGGVSSITPAGGALTTGSDTYYPVALPGDKSTNYSYTGSSTQAIVASAGTPSRLVHTIGSSNNTGYITHTDSGAPLRTGSALVVLDLDYTAGGSLTVPELGIELMRDTVSAQHVWLRLLIDADARQIQAEEVSGLVGDPVTYGAGDVLEVFIDVDADLLKGSAWFRIRGDAAWTAIVEGQTLTTSVSGTERLRVGKMNASTATMGVLLIQPGITQGYASGDVEGQLLGVVSSVNPTLLPGGAWASWSGSPLRPGAAWLAKSVSARPLTLTSPWHPTRAAPSHQWQGDELAEGSSYIAQVWDTYATETTHPLAGGWQAVGWANAPGVATVELVFWFGGAWTSVIEASTVLEGFGSVGVAWGTDGVLIAYQYTGASRTWARDELAGLWAYWSDGTHEMAGRIAGNSPGRWSSDLTGVQAMLIEIDESTRVVLAGDDEAWSDATGTLEIYAEDGAAVQLESGDACSRYVGVRVTMARGWTTPASGLWVAGTADGFTRQEREGSSWQVSSADNVTAAAGVVGVTRERRRGPRTVELAFDKILSVQGQAVAGTEVPTFHGWTGRPVEVRDNPVQVIQALHRNVGQRALIGVTAPIETPTSAPTTTPLRFLQERILWGRIAGGYGLTASRGQVLAPGNGHQRGTALVVTEEV